MDEWKDANKCLPSIGAKVFVCSESIGIQDGMVAHKDHKTGMSTWIVDGALCFDVTHWMPKHYPELPQDNCGDPFCVRELNNVPVVAYQPEGCMPKAVGYSWLSKDAVQEIADNLNEIWTEKEKETKTHCTFSSEHDSNGRNIIVFRGKKSLWSFDWDMTKEKAAMAACVLNDIWQQDHEI